MAKRWRPCARPCVLLHPRRGRDPGGAGGSAPAGRRWKLVHKLLAAARRHSDGDTERAQPPGRLEPSFRASARPFLAGRRACWPSPNDPAVILRSPPAGRPVGGARVPVHRRARLIAGRLRRWNLLSSRSEERRGGGRDPRPRVHLRWAGRQIGPPDGLRSATFGAVNRGRAAGDSPMGYGRVRRAHGGDASSFPADRRTCSASGREPM